MLAADPKFSQAAVDDVNQRLLRATSHLVTQLLSSPGQSDDPSSINPESHALQALMREAAVTSDQARLDQLYASYGDVFFEEPASGSLAVHDWGDLNETQKFLLQSAFADDVGLTTKLVAASNDVSKQFQSEIDQVLADLELATPVWHQEFHCLVNTVVLATSHGEQARYNGASAFASWGAILLNPIHAGNVFNLAVTLIHESSHLKLFYAYLDDYVVLNDPDQSYYSPLRRSNRPMNGIFHAGYVTVRMASFLGDLLKSKSQSRVIASIGEQAAWAKLGSYCEVVQDCFDVIDLHAELTDKGQELLLAMKDEHIRLRSIG